MSYVIMSLKNRQSSSALLQYPTDLSRIPDCVVPSAVEPLMDKYYRRFGCGRKVFPKPVELVARNIAVPPIEVAVVIIGSIGPVVRVENHEMQSLRVKE